MGFFRQVSREFFSAIAGTSEFLNSARGMKIIRELEKNSNGKRVNLREASRIETEDRSASSPVNFDFCTIAKL